MLCEHCRALRISSCWASTGALFPPMLGRLLLLHAQTADRDAMKMLERALSHLPSEGDGLQDLSPPHQLHELLAAEAQADRQLHGAPCGAEGL